MKQNKAGRGTGLTLVLLLIVALIVAFLLATQMNSAVKSGPVGQETSAVQQAQDVVDALNGRMLQADDGREAAR